MRGNIRGLIAAGVIVLAILAAIVVGQQKPDSPEHSTNSDAANGASAVVLYAAAMGHPTHQVTGSFEMPATNTMLFVFTPTSPYTYDEARATAGWVRDGGALVYASEQGDVELDTALNVNRFARLVPSDSADASVPFLDGVTTVAGGTDAVPFAHRHEPGRDSALGGTADRIRGEDRPRRGDRAGRPARALQRVPGEG